MSKLNCPYQIDTTYEDVSYDWSPRYFFMGSTETNLWVFKIIYLQNPEDVKYRIFVGDTYSSETGLVNCVNGLTYQFKEVN